MITKETKMTHYDPEDLNGRRCDACGHLFPSDEAIEREFSVLADNMYGRPPSPLTCVEDCCPNCDSTDLTPMALCEDCLEREATEGSDQCVECENRALRVYERQQEEGYRGGEAAAALSEEQSRIQRELK